MLRLKRLATVLVSGTVMVLAGIFSMEPSLAEPPKTVQVKPGGASIFAQPRSAGEVIGEYKAGVILSPTLRVYSNEGQIWLKIGEHWVPEASLQVIEGVAPSPATASPEQPATAPSASTPEQPATVPPASTPEQPATAPPASTPEQPVAAPSASTPEAPSASTPEQPATAPPASTPEQPLPDATTPPSGKPLDAPPVPTSLMAVVVAKDPDVAINVRSQPSTESDAVLAVKPGQKAEVLKQIQGKDTYTWYKLKFAKTESEGWMRGDFVQVQSAPPSDQSAQPPASAEAVVSQQAKNPGSVTAPSGVFVALQAAPALDNATQHRAASGQKVDILKMAKGEDGFAWYHVQFLDNAAAKGWVRGDQVRLLANLTSLKSAKLSAPAEQIVQFYPEFSEREALPIRGVSGSKVEVLKQAKGANGYAWYSVKVLDKPSAQGWVKGENLRLEL